MDATRRSGLQQFRVGVFVLVSLLALGGLVYLLGRGAGLFERQYRLVAGFGKIGGLIEGATVRLAGVAVGHVGTIRLPAPGGDKVQVELLVARRVQDRIRGDSIARIDTLGLLGDKIIDITLGSPTAPMLTEGAEVRTEEPLETTRLAQQGGELLRNLVELSTELRATLARLGPAGGDLADTVRALRGLAVELEQGQGVLHRLIYDRKLGTAVADAAEALQRTGDLIRRIDRVLADPRTAALAGEAERTLGEAREAAQRVNRILREVEEGRGLLHALVYDEGRLLRELEALLARAATLLASTERGEGALGVLLRDPAATQAARRLVAAAEGLADAVDRARVEDSVLRLLLADSGVATDLRETARGFREVTARVARGEGVLGGLTQPGGEQGVRKAADALGQLGDALGGDVGLKDTLTDLRAAMADLRAIAAKIRAGEGTIGGLVQDPTVYENLAAFLEGAQRSLILRALIRSAVPRGAPPAAPGTSVPGGGPRP